MILFAFVLFAVLIAGWLAAPASSEESVPAKAMPAPSLQLSESPA